ncbi:MAG: hypothetical protein ACTSVU_01970 [Promethearchaeota archaeon]
MQLIEKWKTKWNLVDKPEHERVFLKAKWTSTAIIALISFVLGYAMLFGLDAWEKILPRITENPHRYAMPGWAASYFIYLFMMGIPLITANIFYQKTHKPAFGFASLGGYIAAAGIFMFTNLWFGAYTIWVSGFALLGNAINQRDYSLRAWHLIYYAILGIIGCYINTVIQMVYWDVWVWLQFIHMNLFMFLIGACKIRQWGYSYLFGWALTAIYFLINPHLLIFKAIPSIAPFPEANLTWAAVYNLFVPPLLVWVVMTYFFHIQRKVIKKSVVF